MSVSQGRRRAKPGTAMHLASKALLAVLLLAACVALAACGGTGSSDSASTESSAEAFSANVAFQPEGEPARGGTLTFAHSLPVTGFTPWTPGSNGDVFADTLVYDGLVEYTGDPEKLEPAIAQSWRISKDGLDYTFQLRKGVKFSNGQPVKPSDVQFTIENAADVAVDPSYAGLFANVESVSVDGPATVTIHLSKPTPAMIYNLAVTGASIVPEDLVKSIGATAFGVHPVGAGPFMVAKFTPGSPDTLLKRNPHYWKAGVPYLDAIDYEYIGDDNARMLAVQGGSADIAESVPFSQLAQIENTPDVELVKQHLFAGDWILINGFKEPFDETKVRQALAYATPTEQIADVVFHGAAPVSATGNLPTKYLDSSIKPLPHDPAKARKLLDEAGQSNLAVTMNISSGDTVGTQVATILQAAWAEAGIKLSVRQKDPTALLTEIVKGNYELANLPPNTMTSDIPVDDEFDSYFVHSNVPGNVPFVGWNDPEARALIEKATSTEDEAERRKLFSRYQEILKREQPVVGLVHVPNLFAVRTNVHNFVAAGTGWPLLAETWISP